MPDRREDTPHKLLEVIVQSVAEAREAARGGADRLEVVRQLEAGGLTPALTVVREIAAAVSVPLRVMVRNNDGYSTHAGERAALTDAAARFADLGVDGIVIGFARGGQPEIDRVLEVLPGANATKVTFHRAFDQLADPLAAITTLGAVPQVDRILTSGGAGSAAARRERLARYQHQAGERLTIIAGGGVDEEMLMLLAQTKVVREVHVGRAAREGHSVAGAVSAALVRGLRERLDFVG